MDWPSLSVIIPSYNQGKYIERTLLSILGQNYQGELQIIVSDGGSTDETVDVLKKYPQLTWWSERDKGFVDAVNKALAVATGEVVAIQSSDDFYLEGAFAKALTVLAEEPEIGLVSGSEIRLAEDEQHFQAIESPAMSVLSPGAMLIKSCISQHCAFARRAAVDFVGGVRQEVDRCADFDLWYRLLHFYKARILSDYIGVCQIQGAQRTQEQADEWYGSLRRVVESLEADSAYAQRFKANDSLKRETFKRWEIHWYHAAGGEKGKLKSQQLAKDVVNNPLQWSNEMLQFAQFYENQASENVKRPLSKKVLSKVKHLVKNAFSTVATQEKTSVEIKPAMPDVDFFWWKNAGSA